MRISSVVNNDINNVDNQKAFAQNNKDAPVECEYYIKAFLLNILAFHQKSFF